MVATPATVAAIAVGVEGVISAVDPALAQIPGFGPASIPGDALWIGLSLPPGVASPAPSLSLALVPVATPGALPPPVTAGGVPPPAAAPAPLVSWAILDGGTMVPAALVLDETGGLISGGIVELGLAAQWRPGNPPGSFGLSEFLWLRAMLEYGQYPSPSLFSAVLLNAARAPASRTIRDEPLVQLPDSPDGLTRMQLSQTPIVPHSVQIDVDADPGGDVFGTSPGVTTDWEEVGNLGGSGPTAQVFTVDYATGEVTFGDGVHGARPPAGFRNVRATQYQAGGGAAGAVAAGAVNAPLTSVAFVTAVSNPGPASGGTDAEPDSRAILRGAQELRTGGPGGDSGRLRRARRQRAGRAGGPCSGRGRLVPWLPGYAGSRRRRGALRRPGPRHRAAPGARRGRPEGSDRFPVGSSCPGWRAGRGGRGQLPPGHGRGLAGARPRPRPRPMCSSRPGPRWTATCTRISGGDAGAGWPFGGPLQHVALTRCLLQVPGVQAVPQLNVVLDGVRYPPCTDVPIPPNTLPWSSPGGHRLVPVPGAGT